MISVNMENISEQIKRLNDLKTVAKAIEMNHESKGKTETQMIEAKIKLKEIDKAMDILIGSTVDLITQTKSLYELYTTDYVNKFSRE